MAHNQFALLGTRRFAPFFVTQSLGAFNDNVFRNATLVLIAFQMGLSTAQQSLYTNLAPALKDLVAIPRMGTSVNAEEMRKTMNLMLKYGLLKQPVDLNGRVLAAQ